jgi:hypothetical protein
MQDLSVWKEFWKGRVVLEKHPTVKDNPGHILGFVMNDYNPMIRVAWANGDIYNIEPDELLLE